jgi:hypothetical protein
VRDIQGKVFQTPGSPSRHWKMAGDVHVAVEQDGAGLVAVPGHELLAGAVQADAVAELFVGRVGALGGVELVDGGVGGGELGEDVEGVEGVADEVELGGEGHRRRPGDAAAEAAAELVEEALVVRVAGGAADHGESLAGRDGVGRVAAEPAGEGDGGGDVEEDHGLAVDAGLVDVGDPQEGADVGEGDPAEAGEGGGHPRAQERPGEREVAEVGGQAQPVGGVLEPGEVGEQARGAVDEELQGAPGLSRRARPTRARAARAAAARVRVGRRSGRRRARRERVFGAGGWQDGVALGTGRLGTGGGGVRDRSLGQVVVALGTGRLGQVGGEVEGEGAGGEEEGALAVEGGEEGEEGGEAPAAVDEEGDAGGGEGHRGGVVGVEDRPAVLQEEGDREEEDQEDAEGGGPARGDEGADGGGGGEDEGGGGEQLEEAEHPQGRDAQEGVQRPGEQGDEHAQAEWFGGGEVEELVPGCPLNSRFMARRRAAWPAARRRRASQAWREEMGPGSAGGGAAGPAGMTPYMQERGGAGPRSGVGVSGLWRWCQGSA